MLLNKVIETFMIFWKLRNGTKITDKQMTERRLRTADMYDGKIKSPLPIKIDHKIAQAIRLMTNSKYVRYFGLCSRKIIITKYRLKDKLSLK